MQVGGVERNGAGAVRDRRPVTTLADARYQIEAWRVEYNVARPHSGLANRTPAEFAESYLTTAPSTLTPTIGTNNWINYRGQVTG